MFVLLHFRESVHIVLFHLNLISCLSLLILGSTVAMSCSKVNINNPNLDDINEDNFHHLGFNTSSTDVRKEYSDIKVSLLFFLIDDINWTDETHH